MGFCESIAKIILVILNIIFFILGACILGVGIWLKVERSNLFEMMRQVKLDDAATSFNNSSASALNVLAILLIIIGAFTFVTGFCGCCGAINESQCLLYTYAFLVSVVVIVEISIGIYAAIEKNKFENQLKGSLTKLLKSNFNGLSSSNPNAFTMLFSSLMIEGKCCGVNNGTDFGNTDSVWQNNIGGKVQVNPIGCCQFKNSFKFNPDKKVKIDDILSEMEDSTCPTNSATTKVNRKGCIDSLDSTVKKNMAVLIGIAFCIGLFEILCIFFACCVARKD